MSLSERRRIAENQHADLFISIRADSAPNPDARGASVYTLTESGRMVVVDRIAAAAMLDGVALSKLEPETAEVLIDLKQRGAMNISAVFAATLGQEMEQAVPIRSQFQYAAMFAALKARGIPAVLVETGYVTNVGDAPTPFARSGQRRVAKAIANAIQETVAVRRNINQAR